MAYGYEKSVRSGSGTFISKLTNLHIAIPLMFVMLFLWLNGEKLWGAYWEKTTAEAYIIMFGFVLAITFRSNLIWLAKTRFKEGLMNFWVGFVIMFAAMIVLSQYILKGSFSGASISSMAVYPTIAITAFYVAPVEETIFRGVFKEYLKKSLGGTGLYVLPAWLIVMVITSGAFAITHYGVYQGQVMSLWWAFIMGCAFYLGTNFKPSRKMAPLGVPGAIGMHSCYNLFILGILSGGIV